MCEIRKYQIFRVFMRIIAMRKKVHFGATNKLSILLCEKRF